MLLTSHFTHFTMIPATESRTIPTAPRLGGQNLGCRTIFLPKPPCRSVQSSCAALTCVTEDCTDPRRATSLCRCALVLGMPCFATARVSPATFSTSSSSALTCLSRMANGPSARHPLFFHTVRDDFASQRRVSQRPSCTADVLPTRDFTRRSRPCRLRRSSRDARQAGGLLQAKSIHARRDCQPFRTLAA